MRVVAAVLVRMESERFPGKVMRELSGKPMVGFLTQRLSHSKELSGVVVGTGTSESNNVIEEYCKGEKIECFRGSDQDVLDRLACSLQALGAEVGVVVYGDNPLIDFRIVDELVAAFRNDGELDWMGNDLITTFPPGMEVEVFRMESLVDSTKRTQDPSIREHATLFIRKNPSRYRLRNIEAQGVRRRPEIFLGIDTPIDYEVVEEVARHFEVDPRFSLEEVINFMDAHPDLRERNVDVARRWRAYRDEEK